MHHRRVRARAWLMATTGALALVGSLAPAGAGVVGDGTTLMGAGPTRWDLSIDTSSCNTSTVFSPVDDGEFRTKSDAFDGGLTINVDGTDFVDADDSFPLVGQNPVTLIAAGGVGSGIRVTRSETALPGSPTLRSLVALRNTNPNGRNLTVQWDSDLGSDSSEAVRADSSGNAAYGLRDRWVVSSDDATTPSDPVLTFALFGRRASARTTTIVDNFGGGCFGVSFDIRVPGGSTRYLLFFTQMNGSNERAISRASSFDRPGAALLAGIPSRVRSDVLNWNL